LGKALYLAQRFAVMPGFIFQTLMIFVQGAYHIFALFFQLVVFGFSFSYSRLLQWYVMDYTKDGRQGNLLKERFF